MGLNQHRYRQLHTHTHTNTHTQCTSLRGNVQRYSARNYTERSCQHEERVNRPTATRTLYLSNLPTSQRFSAVTKRQLQRLIRTTSTQTQNKTLAIPLAFCPQRGLLKRPRGKHDLMCNTPPAHCCDPYSLPFSVSPQVDKACSRPINKCLVRSDLKSIAPLPPPHTPDQKCRE